MFPPYVGRTKEIAKTPDTSASRGSAANFEHFQEAVQNIQSVTKKEQEMSAATVSRNLSEKQKKNIPKMIHFIWLGRLPDRYVNNLSQISSCFPTHQSCLWTDSRNMAYHSTLLDRYQLGNRINVKNIEKHLEEPPLPGGGALSNKSWQEVRGAFHRENEGTYKNYAAASDIARLMVLYKYGGQYYDVDVFLNIANGLEHKTKEGSPTVRPTSLHWGLNCSTGCCWDWFKTGGERTFPHREALTTERGVLVIHDSLYDEGGAGQGWTFLMARERSKVHGWYIYGNGWLASQSQSYGMEHCLEKIGRYYKRPPQAYLRSTKKTQRQENNTWEKKRTCNRARVYGTMPLTGPTFLQWHLERRDLTMATEKPTKVQDFIMMNFGEKRSDPIETQWRKVNTQNSKASESPF